MSSRIQQHQSRTGSDRPRNEGRSRSVVVTGAAGASGKSLAQQLLARGFHVHCVDSRPMDIPGATCQVIVGGPGFLPALTRLLRGEHIDLVIPTNSAKLSALSAGRMALDSRVDVVMPGPGPTATAQDRLLTACCLWSHGIAVPDFGVPSDFAFPAKALSLSRGALMLRSRWIGGDVATVQVDHPSEVDWASLGDEVFVQEFVPGTTCEAVVYRPLDGKGRLTRVLEPAVPSDGEIGTAYAISGRDLPEIERLAQAAVRAIGLTGPAEVSLRRRADDVPVVLDVRACFGPHSHLVPELLDAVLRDHPSREPVPRVRDRLNGAPAGGFGVRDVRAFATGVVR